MPRIPTHQISDEDDWDLDDLNILEDEPRTKQGVKRMPNTDKEWEDQRRDQWRRKNRQD